MDAITIQSVDGPYQASFHLTVRDAMDAVPDDRPIHCIIDARVRALYGEVLAPLMMRATSVIEIDATEDNKSLENIGLIRALARAGVRRDHLLLAIGGGITQDLTCFAASILFRGMAWALLPTTLLAQADSGIGSKSSINAAGVKNLVGTFHAPKFVAIAAEFLNTLSPKDVRSGVGEMLKVHIIDGPERFGMIADAYDRLFTDQSTMLQFIRRSLEIKKPLIELDEFDRGPRNVMNYGHSFGHAIEAATDYTIPHGIAVTIGADMANFAAARLGRMDESHFRRMHPTLRKNYAGFENWDIPVAPTMDALAKDKKNLGKDLMLILPDTSGIPKMTRVAPTPEFREICVEFLTHQRAA